jgi:hypothetical protein
MKQGFYPDLNEQDYHSQTLLDEPALSYSIAKLLITQTPMHAKYAHPLLGSKTGNKSTRAQDKGTLAHKLILGRGKDIFVMPEEFTDFRKKAVQDLALEQESLGKLVVLQSAIDECSQLVTAFGMQMKQTEYADAFYDPDCQSEIAIYWRDLYADILMQGLIDRFNKKTPIIFDLKVTTDASTKAFEKKINEMAYHIQNAFYRRGVNTLLPELENKTRFVFLVIESSPPYALNCIELSGMFESIADLDADKSIDTWQKCLKMNVWPGYMVNALHNEAYPPVWLLKEKQLG